MCVHSEEVTGLYQGRNDVSDYVLEVKGKEEIKRKCHKQRQEEDCRVDAAVLGVPLVTAQLDEVLQLLILHRIRSQLAHTFWHPKPIPGLFVIFVECFTEVKIDSVE